MGARKNEVLNLKEMTLTSRSARINSIQINLVGKLQKTTLHTISDELLVILLRRLDQKNPDVVYVFWHRCYSHDKKMMIEDGYPLPDVRTLPSMQGLTLPG